VIRVFIVAASPLTRAGLENLLNSRDIRVVGGSENLEAIADQISDVAPDVILIDVTGEQFESALNSIATFGWALDSNLVLLGESARGSATADALRAGIRAVLPRDISADQLAAAIQAAGSGLLVLHPAKVEEGLEDSANTSRAPTELAEPLTAREIEVLQLLASGLSNKEIAARLNISEHTAKFHVASILGKLGAGSRTEAVSLGIRRGLVLL